MSEYYIGQYRDHYAIFDSMGRVQTQYDTHAEAKADLDSYNKTGKPLPEAASKDSVIDKAFKGPVNSMFDTTSKEFKKVGNDVGNDKKAKQTWWNDMKLTARMHKKPYPKINGYTNGDFKPNHEWLMAAIEQCKSVADCECLIKDGYLAISQDKQLVKNLRAVKEGNPSRYVNVKLIQKRLDNGVTPEKVEKHIEWVKENYIKGLQAKKKEFKKKLNEDHSEISNDPEIEELLNLAGCTVEDLDTINSEEDIELDDDDPIDANTSREIDAVMDESFLGIKSKKEKNAKEVTKAEFDKLINDMVSINDAIISKLKTSKWWKSIFEPCYNSRYYKTPNIHEEASNYKREFSAGKCVAPSFSSKFTNINSSDPEVYINLDDPKNIDLSNPDSILDNGYRESKKIIEETIKKLGFSNGKSDKYPDIKVSISQGAYISFDISPIYTGYYKLKDTKNSQNESVNDLDFIMESIFMDINH